MAARTSSASALPWPLYAIDFEASALDEGSYPIEVGLAVWPARDKPIHGWSTLIRPAWRWVQNGRWSRKSCALHGISQSDLELGRQPEDVARALNEVLAPACVAWCDGLPYDAYWARALFEAADIEAAFRLSDWRTLALGLDAAARERALGRLKRGTARHRAREDAQNLLLALACGIGVEPGPVEDLCRREPALAALCDRSGA